jgi:hypothetical protein
MAAMNFLAGRSRTDLWLHAELAVGGARQSSQGLQFDGCNGFAIAFAVI